MASFIAVVAFLVTLSSTGMELARILLLPWRSFRIFRTVSTRFFAPLYKVSGIKGEKLPILILSPPISFPWSWDLASSASPSLLNSMKAKEPYEKRSEDKRGIEGERIGAEEAARKSSRNQREYLEVDVASPVLVELIGQVLLLHIARDVTHEQAHI